MDGTALPPTLASAATLLSQAPTHPAAAAYVGWLQGVMPRLQADAAGAAERVPPAKRMAVGGAAPGEQLVAEGACVVPDAAHAGAAPGDAVPTDAPSGDV